MPNERKPRGLLAFAGVFGLGLTAALLALLVVGPPLWGAISSTIQYLVDDPLGTNPVGTLGLCKRDDSLSALTPIEGDAIECRTDGFGALWGRLADSTGAGITATSNALDINVKSITSGVGVIACNASAVISTATSGNVELVAISGSTVVYVCGFDVTSVADVSIQFVSGTGTACATGETNKTGLYQLNAASGAGLRGIARGNGTGILFKGAAGEAVCIELSGAVQVDGLLTYAQF